MTDEALSEVSKRKQLVNKVNSQVTGMKLLCKGILLRTVEKRLLDVSVRNLFASCQYHEFIKTPKILLAFADWFGCSVVNACKMPLN